MSAYFYDIESTQNVFTLANWMPDLNQVDLYVLLDHQKDFLGKPGFGQQELRYIADRVHENNPNAGMPDENGKWQPCKVRLLDLHSLPVNVLLAKTFGLSDARQVNDRSQLSSYATGLYAVEGVAYPIRIQNIDTSCFRPVCDTDPEYDPDAHPYLMGYNSANYDTTLLAAYLNEVFSMYAYYDYQNTTPQQRADPNFQAPLKEVPRFLCTTAERMKIISNEMFLPRFNKSMPSWLATPYNEQTHSWGEPNYQRAGWRIRKNMLMTGRHVDVARLNEKQQHVGLKRIIGMLGGQILESSKIKPGQDVIENLDQLADLLAYNVSDVVNLDKVVFQHKTYQSQFALKKGLLKTYPELIYQKKTDAYAPDIRPDRVRNDRLFIDSSSAQLATRSLCPYDHLKDIETVSFLYPSEAKSKELGIPRVNILDQTDTAFKVMFPQPELRAQWQRIYDYYKSIEGKNFNSSENYRMDYPDMKFPPFVLSEIPKVNTCIPYFDKDGNPTSCFALFSTGGIHGAEYNLAKFVHDHAKWEAEDKLMQACQAQFPDPLDLKKAKTVTIDGVEYKASKFVKSGSTMKHAEYKTLTEPQLFVADTDGNFKLNAGKNGYSYTSADPTNHEDFTSYYPNLLRMMSAFMNPGLGYDRYAEIFDNKQNYGVLMKPKNAHLTPEQAEKYKSLREGTGLPLDPLIVSDDERAMYANLREGTKLILNSASGAADANFESNIRMNNQIISMRIIGQLFSYTIAQAQTFQGAKITSTNTDGLYSVMEAEENARILAKESANIGVEIEPEPTYLISKDTNNRIELDPDTREIQSASGGTVGCRKGPNPTKALSHPAIIDWALAEYLVQVALGDHGLSLADDFSEKLGREILDRTFTAFPDKKKWLLMFQNIIASSPGSVSYIFATRDSDPGRPIPLQHYNRVFIMKEDTPNTVHLFKASSKKLTPQTIRKRLLNHELQQQHDPVARIVLTANGVDVDAIPQSNEASVSKCTNIDDRWCMYIQNSSLEALSDQEIDFILDNLDMDKYLGLLRDAYTTSWMNTIPGHVSAHYEDDPPAAPDPEDDPPAAPDPDGSDPDPDAPVSAPSSDSTVSEASQGLAGAPQDASGAPDVSQPSDPVSSLSEGIQRLQGVCVYAQSIIQTALSELDAVDMEQVAIASVGNDLAAKLDYFRVIQLLRDARDLLDPQNVIDAL